MRRQMPSHLVHKTVLSALAEVERVLGAKQRRLMVKKVPSSSQG